MDPRRVSPVDPFEGGGVAVLRLPDVGAVQIGGYSGKPRCLILYPCPQHPYPRARREGAEIGEGQRRGTMPARDHLARLTHRVEAIDRLERRALATGRMHEPITVDVNESGTVANVTIPIDGKGTDDVSVAALAQLREEIVPNTVGALPDVEAGVTGVSAQWQDSTDSMKSTLPPVVAFVLVLAFGLMLVAFRSIVVAAKAIVLNLLSVGAAYGLIVLVFQKGVGNELFGFPQVDSIEGVDQGQREKIRFLARNFVDAMSPSNFALTNPQVIERAKGILMARQRINDQKAFELLRTQSRRSGRKLVDVAQAVIESHMLLVPPSA